MMSTLRPSLEELERTIFVRPLDLQRQEELESEVSYFERFLKNETAGDIRDCLGIPHSELWHRTKKIVSMICTHYTTFHNLDRFKKSSLIDETHLSRLIDSIASQDDILRIIQERQYLKSYIRWLIMNHTRGNHALVNKMTRTERRSLSLDFDGGVPPVTTSRPSSRRQSIYVPEEMYGGASPRHSRRNSVYFPDHGDNFSNYRMSEDGYHYDPSHHPASSSSRSSFDSNMSPTMSPRRQSIMKITDILNTEGIREY
ncbi:hypothetical protein TWF569_008251 [Orbilia oligospora]|uniref:Uncharacterized protein n=2 Tax=Orbilia oligospora TaxID=2813651 RepID=A0A7C8PSA8_ORBOL|nr:hypothetical protein TWF103_003441 [Orbilia oligospora]KAF3082102.1 hypothetical protein TWF706_001933 [Orbilia oligospora]KAF3084556.1 hypothetical protein TWF102_011865 [Orbilia oligospora]KAF3123348.1 hypothetical protein TWF594_002465 [Orbilia oligospora]KAF3140496.1 hypothetical protein TWF569_008251 [Orbilia oligospora]